MQLFILKSSFLRQNCRFSKFSQEIIVFLKLFDTVFKASAQSMLFN